MRVQVLAAVRPKVRVIGCQPANSCVMMQCVRAGRILDLPSTHTLSDGTAGARFSQQALSIHASTFCSRIRHLCCVAKPLHWFDVEE